MRALIACATCALLAATASAQSNDEILAEAAAAFGQGVEHKDRLLQARQDFARATDSFLELHRRGFRSAALYRNLGNAALLADRWPEAIWAYHMGLALDPNDAVLREHLAFARSKIIYPAAGQGRPPLDVWPAWLPRPTLGGLFSVFAISYLVAVLSGAAAIARHRMVLFVLAGAFLLLAIATGMAAGVIREQQNADRAAPLVIVQGNTPLYLGNGPSYPQHAAVPMLPRGLEARIVHRRGDWLQVRLSSGEVGWLPRGQVLIVESAIE